MDGWVKVLMYLKRDGETIQQVKAAAAGLTDADKAQMVDWAKSEGILPA